MMSTDELICPFMSPDGTKHYTYCQKERCMAWGCVEKFVAKDIKHEVYEHKVMGCMLIP